MAKYRKKPVVIEAFQWKGHEDNNPIILPYENNSIAYSCEICGKPLTEHGLIKTLEGMMKVCPNDFIITGVKGEQYCCKEEIFYRTYTEVKPRKPRTKK